MLKVLEGFHHRAALRIAPLWWPALSECIPLSGIDPRPPLHQLLGGTNTLRPPPYMPPLLQSSGPLCGGTPPAPSASLLSPQKSQKPQSSTGYANALYRIPWACTISPVFISTLDIIAPPSPSLPHGVVYDHPIIVIIYDGAAKVRKASAGYSGSTFT